MIQTKEQKKSFLITVLLFAILFLLLFFFGLSYLDPKPEQGIAINFGNTETGAGDNFTTKEVNSAPPSTSDTENEQEVVEDATPPEVEENSEESTDSNDEKLLTQDISDADIVKEKESDKPSESVKTQNKKPVEKVEEKVAEKASEKVAKEKPKVEKPKVERRPDESTKNILDSFLKGKSKDGEVNQGDGNSNTAGNQGSPDGNPNSKSYYGTGKGLDGDGNYLLGGRKALNKEKKVPDCNETGTVVVKIVVNQQGQVIQAYPGIKGTTNTAPCLIQPAKEAALATKFNSDANAPTRQIGSIIYKFKLSE